MKRWIVLPVLASLALAAFAPAQAVPSDPTDPVCARAHITGEDCQGPDHYRSEQAVFAALAFFFSGGATDVVGDATLPPDECRIGVWVGKVTCSGLLPPDGDGTTVNAGVWAFNDAGETATLTVRLIDEVTGAVLKEDTKSSDTQYNTPVGTVTSVSIAYAAFYGYSFDHPVRIEAEGTHAEIGVQTAAVAALDVGYVDPFGLTPRFPNNYFWLEIN